MGCSVFHERNILRPRLVSSFHAVYTVWHPSLHRTMHVTFCDHSAITGKAGKWPLTFSVRQLSQLRSSDPRLLSIYFPSLTTLSTPLSLSTATVNPYCSYAEREECGENTTHMNEWVRLRAPTAHTHREKRRRTIQGHIKDKPGLSTFQVIKK